MRLQLKIYYILLSLLIYCGVVNAQFKVDTLSIDTIKEIKEVPPVEADFLFSYYEQDGTKSPVTGGIGNEELRDRVVNITLVIPISNKVTFNFYGGLDSYSSASTDNINNEYGLYTETSASYSDIRKYGSIGVNLNNDKRKISYGIDIGASKEYDVNSYNANINFSKLSKNRNTLYYFKAIAYYDEWKMIYPAELRWKYLSKVKKEGEEDDDYDTQIRNTFSSIISIEQDFTPRLKGSITIEPTIQSGLLSTPFHRVYFIDSGTHDIELLPNNRMKFPLGIHLNYYFNKYLVSRLFYRYYTDDFGIIAHTASIEFPIKPIRTITIAPFYRFHNQTASKFFQPFGFHSINDEFYTSDFDLADIKSNRIGAEIRWSPSFISDSPRKKLVFKKLTIRGSKYFRYRQKELILKSYIVSFGASFRIE